MSYASKLLPSPCFTATGTPWSGCPRSTLKQALQLLRDQHQLRLMVGFELEFVLLRRTQGSNATSSSDCWREVDQSQYCHSGALDSCAAGA
jgi:glutamine synthetase